MAVPLQIQLFDSFLGSQQGIHSIILPDVFSSGGSKNLWIDKFGRAKKIAGYTKQNTSPVVTNTGGSATRLRALFPYRASSGGSFTRVLIGIFDDGVDEQEVWKSTDDGVTWTFVQDLGASSVGSVPDFSQFGNVLIFTNGAVAPQQFDGTTWSTAGSTQLAAPSASASTTGNLAGTYKWRLVPIKNDGTRKVASAASSALSIQDKQASLSWTADADTNVVGYELYRTSGTGEVFYFVDYIDGRLTVSYVDNTGDLTILENRNLQEHGDAPPVGAYFCEAHKQRMWYFRTDAFPQTGWYSDPGDPDSVYDQNQITFSDSDSQGDVITGAMGDYEGRIVVFQERSIWAVSGTGQVIGNIQDWSRIRTNAQVGTVSGRTIVRIPAGSRFTDQNGKFHTTDVVTLAYLTPLLDIRLFDGDNDVIISHPVKEVLSELNYEQRDRCFHISDITRGEVAWVIPTGSNGEPNRAVVWNYRWGVWYEREWGFSCGIDVESSTESSILLAGDTDSGTCFKLWSGNSFDGAPIEAIWMTKNLYGVLEQTQPALTHTKRWRWVDFLFETEQNVTLTVEWMPGNVPDTAEASGSTTITPAAFGLLTAGGDRILTTDGDRIVVAQASSQRRALLKDTSGNYIHDPGLRIRVGDNASNGSWSLEAFSLAYQILPGLGRRMP